MIVNKKKKISYICSDPSSQDMVVMDAIKVAAQLPQFRRYCYFNFNAKCLKSMLWMLNVDCSLAALFAHRTLNIALKSNERKGSHRSIDAFTAKHIHTHKMNWHVYSIYNILWYIHWRWFSSYLQCQIVCAGQGLNATQINLLAANH